MTTTMRDVPAIHGLELLKHSVLCVLYEEHLGENRRLTRIEISQRLGIKKPDGRDADNIPLIEGILIHLQEDEVVDRNAVNRWRITEDGISHIEGD